jgi:protein O-GlcNAc transferase
MSLLDEARSALRKGDNPTAYRLYSEALRASPRNFEALSSLGLILTGAGHYPEAERMMAKAVAVEPRSPEALYVLGCLHQLQGRNADAVAMLSRAIELAPNYPQARVNRAALLMETGRSDDALADCDAALAADPNLAEAWNNRGNALCALGRRREAILSYDRALRLNSGMLHSVVNRATALLALGNTAEALDGYRAALKRDSASLDARIGEANALFELRRFGEATRSYEAALACDPTRLKVRGVLAFTRAQCCDWRTRAADCATIAQAIAAGVPAINPFQNLALSDSPAQQLACARAWSRAKYQAGAQPLWRGESYAHERLRIAYVSADFRDHAVALSMAGVFAAHDRARFETVAVSLAQGAGDEMQVRLKGCFERFIEVGEMDDPAVAAALRHSEIDIVIDLMGHTADARPGILALRPAPVQALFLGFPATTGTDFIDAILADATVIPPEDEPFFSEAVVRLPHTYLPTDDKRAIGPAPSRDEAGLPNKSFVFASFNNSYKITPEMFTIWMRLLRGIEESVLWLPDAPEAKENLTREATAHGIAEERLVFAPHVPRNADHLARLSLADLVLDTLPYNAHTTATDALWAGVPVLTCRGKTFAGRVAASALTAVGLPELIAESLAEYETRALAFARNPAALAEIRATLARNRTTMPLFDTVRFTRNLEAALVFLTSASRR